MHRKMMVLFVVSGLCLAPIVAGAAGLKATNPNPADGAKGVASPLLQWKAAEGIILHNVYLGTTPDLTAANQVGTRVPMPMYWHIPGFQPGTTYYWRVDSVKVDGTTVQGDLWHFTTAPVQAFDPRPWNKARWIHLDVELSWTPGAGAQSHDVYFGTDQAAVTARDASVSKGNQAKPSYAPGQLKEMTTYYWAVDEHTTSGQKNPGEVWSFTTTGPGGGVKAEYFKGMVPTGESALTRVDPAIDFSWGDPGGPDASIGVDQFSARWTADLEGPLTGPVTLFTSSDDGVRLWLDGKLIINNWTDHGTTEDQATVNMVVGQIYSLRMEYYENTGGAVATLSWAAFGMDKEIIPAGPLQLPMHAECSYPAAGAADVPQALVLRWDAGDEAAQHDVYFGDSAEAVANATPDSADVYQGRQALDELTFDPGPLQWNKTYYWRVDEINAAKAGSPWTGRVWDFTTADFIVVDDFEQYTDNTDAGQAIFQTWIDGWTNNNGSRVGYINPPFAEQKIVAGGGQSMPLDYNNVVSPFYSQAERTWDTPQDWTVNGVSTLLLNFRGGSRNADESLYVMVEDSAGKVGTVIYPDSSRISFARWTTWQVPLSQFQDAGVNLAAVEKVVIGLGNPDKPKAGGGGLLLLDDIRVVKTGLAVPTVLFAEDFEGLPLGKNKDEGLAGEKVWTKTAPAGWTIDDKGVPGAGDPAQDGVTEWAGWSFADKVWWTTTAGDQDRSTFTLGSGTVAIADPDEWDDLAHATGQYNTYLSTPPIDISTAEPGTVVLTFDSSWRPEYADYGRQTGNLKVSFDGGKAVQLFLWESNTASPNYKPYATNETVKINVDNPAGAKKMVLTFGLFDCGNNWWWAIDNIEITGMPAK